MTNSNLLLLFDLLIGAANEVRALCHDAENGFTQFCSLIANLGSTVSEA
ncbi:MAG: hypothetical protein WAV20_06350 [Blastocatellia bacterium]